MHFRPDAVESFHLLFDSVKHHIRKHPGCRSLSLMQDADHPCIIYTYSIWDSTEHLDQYRNSAFFADTWRQTKILFEQKAQAFSLIQLEQVEV
jgi:quinol monooxygenase YgiN